jgi:hypothetical protein
VKHTYYGRLHSGDSDSSWAAPAAQRAGEKCQKRTQGDDDAESVMKKLEDLYGQKQGRAEKPVPFKEVRDLMKRVHREREEDASNASTTRLTLS